MQKWVLLSVLLFASAVAANAATEKESNPAPELGIAATLTEEKVVCIQVCVFVFNQPNGMFITGDLFPN